MCPRSAGKGHSWIKKQEVVTICSYHQKTLIVDAEAGHHKRKIISFLGGLDLCMGRYDTPNHSILCRLKTVHADDYHNPTFSESDVGFPRQPWHDLHCRIDGPATYDVLTNFEER